jgi:hypothetical protein
MNDETKLPYILIDLNKQVLLEVRMIKSMHPVNRQISATATAELVYGHRWACM